MDIKENLILIKGDDKTKDVQRIERQGRKSIITFSSGKQYTYNSENITWQRTPQILDLEKVQLYRDGKPINNISEAYVFGEHVKYMYNNGFQECVGKKTIEFVKNAIQSQDSKSFLDYCREISVYTSVKSDEGQSILTNRLNRLSFVHGESCLATYICKRLPTENMTENHLIYPFGCNLSQKEAVKRAMANKISVIEGPPGTGKTQTILNIIANILIENKTVAVVSNNNSATSNVYEKLMKYNLSYVAAFLGNSDNKKSFIELQEPVPTMDRHSSYTNLNELRAALDKVSSEIEDKLELKNRKASLKSQRSELTREFEYYKEFHSDTYDKDDDINLNKGVTSSKILEMAVIIEDMASKNDKAKISFIKRLFYRIKYGKDISVLLNRSFDEVNSKLNLIYYKTAIDCINTEIADLDKKLSAFDFDKELERLSGMSMEELRVFLEIKYTAKKRQEFGLEDLWKNSHKILEEYPVILSTTFSVTSSLSNGTMYDYVIVDEASQVDLVTGVLALSCAKNIVIVGDLKQLPNVITSENLKVIENISRQYGIEDALRYEENSLLSSVTKLFEEVPRTLLKEHYRCHPDIIQFCNKKFYDNQLIVMTEGADDGEALKVYRTVEGNHARNRVNIRQIDVIKDEIMPPLTNAYKADQIGIIAPYRAQKKHLESIIKNDEIEMDTVHKYQGREKECIILSTVDNVITEFTDNPNMLNVAVSRAKERLIVVVSGDEANHKTNVGDLVRYIEYNNYSVVDSKIYSVFDMLYKAYDKARIKYLAKSNKISKFDSENIAMKMISDLLGGESYMELDLAVHVPLRAIVKDISMLSEEEADYVMNPWTHVDFVIFRKIDNSILICIEIDGYNYHKEGTVQADRDLLKNQALDKYGISLMRLNTTGSQEQDKLREILSVHGYSYRSTS